jgi:putative DNA primase/helicase
MENNAINPNDNTIEEQEVSLDKTFNETNTDEGFVKKILNTLLSVIIFFDSTRWQQIHEELNAGIVGKEVGSKDCYRIGFINYLKEFAKNSNVLFAKDGNNFYIFNGEYWIKITEDLLKGFLHIAAKQMGIPESLSSCVKFIKGTYEQLLESGFFEKMVQSNVTYLNLLNGTLKIDKNGVELIPFNPKHFLTHQLDFIYTKNVVNQIWLDFLDTVLPDKDTQRTLQQAIGYLFIRDLKLEKVIFLYGIGSNGKSVIFEVIKGILAADMMSNYSLASLTNHLGYQLADLHNKLINYGTDISMKNVDIAIFKQIASGEPIGTRQIREKAFTMKNYGKLIFNVNKLDDADVENTNGFIRRLLHIPFDEVIEEENQDKNIHKKLLENKTGIMNWIIEGIEKVLTNEEIFISEKCANFLDNFKRESSPIQLFLEDSNLVPTSQELNETIDFQQVYEMYREFCKKQGEKAVAQRSLNADLKRLGFEWKRRKQGNVWFAKIESL